MGVKRIFVSGSSEQQIVDEVYFIILPLLHSTHAPRCVRHLSQTILPHKGQVWSTPTLPHMAQTPLTICITNQY